MQQNWLRRWNGRFMAGLLVLLAFAAPGAAADGMRCGSDLISTGDWPVEVREVCGEPDYIAIYPQQVLAGFGLVREVQHWYYNRGSNEFIRRLVFRDGELRRIDSLGYGFNRSSSCSAREIQEGMSEFELLQLCGEPEERRVDWRVYRSGIHHATNVKPVAEWLYNFGDTRFRRVVRLEDGNVRSVERRDKPD